MPRPRVDVSAAHWRKSSYSNQDGGNCVEVADDVPGLVPVRDSKQGAQGPALVFGASAWSAFVDGVRASDARPGTH